MADRVIRLTKRQLDGMTGDQLTNLILRAHRVQATCVVRRADGSIKYDQPALAGQYGEDSLQEAEDDGGSEAV